MTPVRRGRLFVHRSWGPQRATGENKSRAAHPVHDCAGRRRQTPRTTTVFLHVHLAACTQRAACVRGSEHGLWWGWNQPHEWPCPWDWVILALGHLGGWVGGDLARLQRALSKRALSKRALSRRAARPGCLTGPQCSADCPTTDTRVPASANHNPARDTGAPCTDRQSSA